jgi:hypothetical protein
MHAKLLPKRLSQEGIMVDRNIIFSLSLSLLRIAI